MVLFPNAPLPLHVFEERYKLMVQRCLDADSRFGVVLIKSGSDVGEPAEPYSVGTVARIVKVDRMDDGRMLLSVVGQSRFRIEEITQRRPYLEGRVEELEDREAGGEHPPPKEMDAIRRAASQHVSLIMGLRGGWVRNVVMPGDPAAPLLSYRHGPSSERG